LRSFTFPAEFRHKGKETGKALFQWDNNKRTREERRETRSTISSNVTALIAPEPQNNMTGRNHHKFATKVSEAERTAAP